MRSTKSNPDLGRRTANFATASPEESRGKFTGAYNPPTLRNMTENKNW